MNMLLGKSYRQPLDDGKYLDVSVYPTKWITRVNMSLWQEGNGVALSFYDKWYLNYDKVLPIKLAKKIGEWSLNKQSMRVAGFKLVVERR